MDKEEIALWSAILVASRRAGISMRYAIEYADEAVAALRART